MCREYLELDEFTNAFDYLKKTKLFLDNKDDIYWAKWVTLSLSDALYHFMLCALGYSNYRKIIDYSKMNKKEKEISKSLPDNYTAEEIDKVDIMIDKYINSGRGKVISFPEALDRIQQRKYLPHMTFVEDVILSSDEVFQAKKLRQSFRNNFQHYRNMSWAIELQYLKPLFKATISIIDKIYKSNSLRGYYHKSHYGNLKELIDDVKEKIEEI